MSNIKQGMLQFLRSVKVGAKGGQDVLPGDLVVEAQYLNITNHFIKQKY